VLGVVVMVAMISTAALAFIFHFSVHPVLTGSMVPTYSPGSIIVTRPMPVSQVRRGDIVVIIPPGLSVAYAHRVVSVTGSPSHPIIRTKGDANAADDPWHAKLTSNQVPEVVATVPYVGRLAVLLNHANWTRILVIAGGGSVVLVAGMVLILSGDRRRGMPDRSPGNAPLALVDSDAAGDTGATKSEVPYMGH
jgi:signal peptidase I